MENKPPITYPYRGARRSWYVYHPAYHGMSDKDGQWEESAKRFYDTLNDFLAVTEMYNEHETRHETVGGDALKKEVLKIFTSIERNGKDVYVLEALAETLFDTSDKVSQRLLPYEKELQEAASMLRREDLGLSLGGGLVDPASVVRRSWSS